MRTPLCVLGALLCSLQGRGAALRTSVLNRWVGVPPDLLRGREGEYSLLLYPHASDPHALPRIVSASIEDSCLLVGPSLLGAEDASLVVGLVAYALKCAAPAVEILHCKEYAVGFAHVEDLVAAAAEGEERVDWVAECGAPICSLPRSVIHYLNLLHRGIGVVVLSAQSDEIFVHKRSDSKRVFPSMLDMLVGGVSVSGESTMHTLVRELREELNIDASVAANDTSMRLLGSVVVETSYNHCLVDCFAIRCGAEVAAGVRFNDGEVQWGKWMTATLLAELLEVQREAFVPDGLQVWDAIPSMLSVEPCDFITAFLMG